MDELEYLEVADGFEDHLKNNDTILFSGIYGIGKTTYLKQYFKKNDEYISFHLYPVNYAVSDNLDIFELIKADLLYQLLDYIDVDTLTENDSIYKNPLAGYFAENYDKIFIGLFKKISKTGKLISDIIDELQSVKKGFAKYKDDLDKTTKEYKVSTFFNSIDNLKGSPYESDAITMLIEELIELIKENNKDKKIVFIIDDLDRIDPAHVFRILNIFSAHFDGRNKNKFPFDKIITVADYENLKGIYHHFYGRQSSFNGYIDKFVSKEVYRINFTSTVFRKCYDVFNKKVDSYGQLKTMVSRLIEALFVNDEFNFRRLERLEHIQFDIDNSITPSTAPLTQFIATILYLYDYDINDIVQKLNAIKEIPNGFRSDFRHQKSFYLKVLFSSLYGMKPELFSETKEEEVEKVSIQVNSRTFHFTKNSWHDTLEPSNDKSIQLEEFFEVLIYYFRNQNSAKLNSFT